MPEDVDEEWMRLHHAGMSVRVGGQRVTEKEKMRRRIQGREAVKRRPSERSRMVPSQSDSRYKVIKRRGSKETSLRETYRTQTEATGCVGSTEVRKNHAAFFFEI